MSYTFAPYLLLRRPIKTPANYLADPQVFLDDAHFRAALWLASLSFFRMLEKKHFQAKLLSEREVQTLQKYINRYCFRPTPFGLFASVTPAIWTDQAISGTPDEPFVTRVSTAMPVQHRLQQQLLDSVNPDQLSYEANPSIYRVLQEYRFFRSGLDESGRQRHYQLQSIAYTKLLKELLSLCHTGCSFTRIVQHIKAAAGCPNAEAEDYALFLVDAQLLVHRLRASISGPEPLARLIGGLENSAQAGQIRQALKRQAESLTLTSEHLEQLGQELQNISPQAEPATDQLNVILYKSATFQVEQALQGPLRAGLRALELLNPQRQPANLSAFITAYQQHFEGQSLPLLVALDPEAGIGYQLPETERPNPLLDTVPIAELPTARPGIEWSAAHRVLLAAWLRQQAPQTIIKLTVSDLEELQQAEIPAPILGMSVLFRTHKDQVWLESAGGINAPALLGRFTTADAQLATAGRQMAAQLEGLNPEVIFAELLHLTDPHTDNVNRRDSIYHYELPLTAASNLPENRQIRLDDLYLRIVGQQVMLYSKRHQKLVVPRLTSAYNHSLNKLPLFRFLADLPYQFGRSQMGLDLQQYFPGQQFYPRVEYQNAILSLATWVPTSRQLELLLSSPDQEPAFTKFREDLNLVRHFSIAEGDQELVIDAQSERDRQMLIAALRRQKKIILKEFLPQAEVKQFNAFLLPETSLRLPRLILFPKVKGNKPRKFMPGTEWLYLKIYAPRIGLNRLLLQLAPLLRKTYAGYPVRQWFFIRYDDHAPHIRLRLQVDPQAVQEILFEFKARLEERVRHQVIREFQLDVYSRELERYAAAGIEPSEYFFWASSELVVHFLKLKVRKNTATVVFALHSVLTVLRQFIADPEAQLRFTRESFEQFRQEYGEQPTKVALDQKYRELEPDIRAGLAQDDPALLCGSVKAGQRFRHSLEVISQAMTVVDQDFLRSIIHMHLNRTFSDEGRRQEMVSYYLLHKYLQSVKGRRQNKSG